MAQFFFRALPVITAKDATMDFEQLTFALNNGDVEVNSKGELKLKAPEAFKAVESLNKIEAGIEVRKELGVAVARITGPAKASAGIPNATRIFTLPAGYRPKATVRIAGADISARTFMQLTLEPNGEAISGSAAEIPAGDFVEWEATWPI